MLKLREPSALQPLNAGFIRIKPKNHFSREISFFDSQTDDFFTAVDRSHLNCRTGHNASRKSTAAFVIAE
jgi:hypothetical protein